MDKRTEWKYNPNTNYRTGGHPEEEDTCCWLELQWGWQDTGLTPELTPQKTLASVFSGLAVIPLPLTHKLPGQELKSILVLKYHERPT